jgi:hypothetical protein
MSKSKTNSKTSSLKVNLTNIKKMLKMAVFNPNAPTPMKAVAQMQEPLYYECRIMELTQQAKEAREQDRLSDYDDLMIQVMQLAALSLLSR